MIFFLILCYASFHCEQQATREEYSVENGVYI